MSSALTFDVKTKRCTVTGRNFSVTAADFRDVWFDPFPGLVAGHKTSVTNHELAINPSS
jgi:hypothetical protein